MITQTSRMSAKIIPLPARYRRSAARDTRSAEASTELRVHQLPVCDYGSGWYHDAAIQDEARDRKS